MSSRSGRPPKLSEANKENIVATSVLDHAQAFAADEMIARELNERELSQPVSAQTVNRIVREAGTVSRIRRTKKLKKGSSAESDTPLRYLHSPKDSNFGRQFFFRMNQALK